MKLPAKASSASPDVIRQSDLSSLANPKRERYLLGILLAAAAFLYAWGLDRNGWANSYYSAAVMAGAQDWTAFLFGSSDASNAISVDKPPLSLWVMAISVRVFGLSSWSILLPQAAFGVLSVFLLFKMVRTYVDSQTALIAAMFFAVTPIATVIFRYNNPDALLTLLTIGVAYATLESIRRQELRWLLLAGGLVGAGFLTKQLQIGLIVPALGIAYVTFAHGSLLRRLLHLVLTAATAAVTGGWWLVVIQITDPRMRPFVGGSMANSVAELTLGYNGLDRLSGQDSATSITSGDWAPLDAMDPGLQRFLQPGFTGQLGWFLPLAIAGAIIAVAQLWRRSRPTEEAAFLVFSVTWFVVAMTVIAFMSGIVHPYYGLTAVPPMCSLAATCFMYFLRAKLSWQSRGFLVVTLVAAALMAYVSASRSTDDFPSLPQVLLLLWALAISFHALPLPHSYLRQISSSVLIFTLILGPMIWSLNTVFTGHIGAGVSAGPSTLGIRADDPARQRLSKNENPSFAALMLGDVPLKGVVDKIAGFPSGITWPGAIIGSESAANYQLETGRPIMAIGGFNGTDPFPTLEQFMTLVDDKKIGALVIQNLPPVPAEGRGESARIVAWVRAHYSPSMIEGAELYDLVK